MRQVLLLRHAKAAPGDGGGSDRERPLTQRGRRDAALMGRFVTGAGWTPDLVVTSPAVRARVTAELSLQAGVWRVPLRQAPALYESSIERALEVLRSSGSDVATLLLVGHEPTWSTLGETLIGGGRLRLPTAGLVCLTFDLDDWAEVEPGSATLHGLVAPAMLRGWPPKKARPRRA